MNYYEHHIRDYDAATSHLSWDEDLAYTRLLRWYYRKERPIPADLAEACRQVRATTKIQRDAVAAVLNEFFDLRADGWHNDTCDEALAKFKAGEPEREAKKKNEETRLDRHRRERAELFAVINGAGHHMAWNTPMAELRAAAARIRGAEAATPETPLQPEPATRPATATATPATATHSPFPIPHPPIPIHQRKEVDAGAAQNAPAPPPPAYRGEKNESDIPKKARVLLSPEWELPEAWGVDAEALGFTPPEILRESERFRQYWVAGKGAGTRRSLRGWRQSWSNWLGNAERYRRTA